MNNHEALLVKRMSGKERERREEKPRRKEEEFHP